MKYISHYDQLPRVSEKGYRLIRVPSKTWSFISEIYDILKRSPAVDETEYLNNQIKNPKNTALLRVVDKESGLIDFGVKKDTSEVLSISEYLRIRSIIMSELYSLHVDFASPYKIKPTTVYGIRSYTHGSVLSNHRDRIETHHISSIVCVDKKCNKDWPLDFQTNDGTWEEIYLEPGDLFIYESARCMHGRKAFDGEFYRNLFISYHFEDFKYIEK